MDTLANSDNQDDAALGSISYGSALFAKINTIFNDKNVSQFNNIDMWPLKTQNGLSHSYCINMFGKIHQDGKSEIS